MYSRVIPLPKGAIAIVCGARPKRLRPCEFCRHRQGENQCDYQVGGPCPKCKGSGERRMSKTEAAFHGHLVAIINGEHPTATSAEIEQAGAHMEALTAGIVCYDCSGSGKRNCNRFFCGERCGVRVSKDEGYCPDHMKLAGHAPRILREQCQWVEKSDLAGRCFRGSCKQEVGIGERILYFPERNRAMHEPCGLEYLRISISE